MSINKLQQLETFAYWRGRVMAAEQGKALWGLQPAVDAKLMNQAPLYVLNGALGYVKVTETAEVK